MTETSPKRGRHRRPRPRKLLFAAGGLALAAGALSLVRLAPDPQSGTVGTAEAEPRQDPDTGAEAGRSDHTVAAVEAVSPSATYAMGEVSATPTAPSSLVPRQTATTSPGPTTAPATTAAPAPRTSPQPPTPTPSTPRPTPTPSSTTPAPTPQPDDPGLCVPAVGLCLGSPAAG